MAVIAATLTSVIIFRTAHLWTGHQFFGFPGHTGVAVVLALLSSLFISLTLIPLAMARLLRMDVSKPVQWQLKLKKWIVASFVFFGRSLPAAGRHRVVRPSGSSLPATEFRGPI